VKPHDIFLYSTHEENKQNCLNWRTLKINKKRHMLVCTDLLVDCVMLCSVTIIQEQVLFPTESRYYFDVSKIMYCTWPRSNKRNMAHLKILSQRLFHKYEWEFKRRRQETDVDILERTEQTTGTIQCHS
jgi:hypothetical protein